MSFEEPKSAVGEYDLPGGVLWKIKDGDDDVLLKHVTLREITGNEEDILTNRKLSIEDKMMQLVANCIINLSNTNGSNFIIDRPLQIGEAVRNMQITDLLYTVLLTRIVSLGKDYRFKVKCPDNDCGYESSLTVDLETLEIVNPLEPEKLIWDVELPASKSVVKMKALQAKDQKKARDMLRQQKDVMTTQLLTRVIEINGLPPTIQDLKKLSLRDRNAIRTSFEKKEGGVETDIEAVCNSCGNRFTVGLQVQGTDFFFPSET